VDEHHEWKALYDRLSNVMREFGKEDPFGHGDYWIVDDDWSNRQQKILFNNLSLIQPTVIEALRRELQTFGDWEIIVTIDVLKHENDWPDMGIRIRKDAVVDDLRRDSLPVEYRHVKVS